MKNDNILNNLYDIMNKLIDKDGKDKKMEDNKLSNNLKEDENRDKKLKKIINKIEKIIKDKDVDLDLINNIIESENYHNKHEHKHHKCKHHKHHKHHKNHKHHNDNNKQHPNEEDNKENIKNKKQEKQDKHKKEEDENKKIISIIESSDSSSSPYSKLKRNITLQHNGIKNNYSKGKYNEKELEEEIDRVLGIRQN